jgi:hypothetical protein
MAGLPDGAEGSLALLAFTPGADIEEFFDNFSGAR